VLGGGGFRGLAHIGVLRALRRLEVPIDSIIGVSMGGLVASFHAGLGYTLDEIEQRLSLLSTSSLFALGRSLYRPRRNGWSPAVTALRAELGRLDGLSLDSLRFGVGKLGLLALDAFTGEEIFAVTGETSPLAPARVVVGGASIPFLFPWVRGQHGRRTYRLVDGGLSHSVPVERALRPPFSAARVIAVDLQVLRGFRERAPRRWESLEEEHPGRILRLRPRVDRFGTVFFREGQAPDLVRAGEESVLEQAGALC
jgi:predicted acylesterase/phospholipase RssA